MDTANQRSPGLLLQSQPQQQEQAVVQPRHDEEGVSRAVDPGEPLLAQPQRVVAPGPASTAAAVLHDLGELEGAEAALRQSRDGLSALGLELFTAVASLDLAATLLRQERSREAQTEALAAQRILLGLERRELFGVLLILDAAFSSGGVTAELVERALALLRRRELESEPRPAT